ncbi:MAG: hypothetical protein ACTSYN_02765, partial [Candidatus Heimdallarchaeaceae archaeon]
SVSCIGYRIMVIITLTLAVMLLSNYSNSKEENIITQSKVNGTYQELVAEENIQQGGGKEN